MHLCPHHELLLKILASTFLCIFSPATPSESEASKHPLCEFTHLGIPKTGCLADGPAAFPRLSEPTWVGGEQSKLVSSHVCLVRLPSPARVLSCPKAWVPFHVFPPAQCPTLNLTSSVSSTISQDSCDGQEFKSSNADCHRPPAWPL